MPPACHPHAASQVGERARYLERRLRDFRRVGLHLDAETAMAVKEINTELSSLGIQFSKNLGEENVSHAGSNRRPAKKRMPVTRDQTASHAGSNRRAVTPTRDRTEDLPTSRPLGIEPKTSRPHVHPGSNRRPADRSHPAVVASIPIGMPRIPNEPH